MKSRRRTPKLKRRKPSLEPKRRFILFCEGENTETEYFKAISRICSSTLISVETHGGVGVPKTIAEKAVERAKALGLPQKAAARRIPTRNATKFGRYLTAMSILDSKRR